MRKEATHLLRLQKRAVMTKMKQLPGFVVGIGLNISTDESVKGSVAGNSVNGDVCGRSNLRFWAQMVHFVIVSNIAITSDEK